MKPGDLVCGSFLSVNYTNFQGIPINSNKGFLLYRSPEHANSHAGIIGKLLPGDVAVLLAVESNDDFHALYARMALVVSNRRQVGWLSVRYLMFANNITKQS